MVCGVAWLCFKCVCNCTDTCMDIIIVKHKSCHMLLLFGFKLYGGSFGDLCYFFKEIASFFCQCFHADAAG